MLISFKDLVKKYDLKIKGIIHVGGHHGEELEDYIDEGIQNILLFEPLSDCFDVIGYKNECAWYHRAYVTMLGVNDEKGESHTIFRGLNHVFTVKSLDNVKTIWHIISKG